MATRAPGTPMKNVLQPRSDGSAGGSSVRPTGGGPKRPEHPEIHALATPPPKSALKQPRLGSPSAAMDTGLADVAAHQTALQHALGEAAPASHTNTYETEFDDLPKEEDIHNPNAPVTVATMHQIFRQYMLPVMRANKSMSTDFQAFKTTMEAEVEEINIRTTNLEDDIEATREEIASTHVELRQEIAELREALQQVQTSTTPRSTTSTARATGTATVVLGGLPHESLEEAETWINKALEDVHLPPNKIYKKGTPDEGFKGLIFVEFDTPGAAQQAQVHLQELSSKSLKPRVGSSRVWCNLDSPIEVRVVASLLLGLRYVLTQWGFEKRYLKVDTEAGIIKAGGKPIMRATVEADILNIIWLDPDWEKWSELQSAPEWAEVEKKARERLSQSRARASKGAGKGKDKN